LSAYAQKTFSNDMNIDLTVSQGEKNYTMKVTADNSIVLQRQKMGGLDEPITVEASGKGIAVAQVSWHYNVPQLREQEPFVCQEDVMDQGGNELVVHLCCKYSDRLIIQIWWSTDSPANMRKNKSKLVHVLAQILSCFFYCDCDGNSLPTILKVFSIS
jgi:hypothetical protein